MKKLNLSLPLIILLGAACGTIATPIPNSETVEAYTAAETEEEEHKTEVEGGVVVLTNTPLPPTHTPAPPTATPTQMSPTKIPATPTLTATVDPLVILISTLGDPINGETLFNIEYTTALGVWRCAQCHYVDREEQLIGPGFLNLREHAEDRIEGVSAESYIFKSITAPNSYIVEGYPENVMPNNYAEILSEQDLYDLASYVLSLSG